MKTIIKQITSIVMCFISIGYLAADDISLTSAKINQLTLNYEKVQISQAQGLTFTGYVHNAANFDHTGIYINLKVVDSNDDTIFNVNSAPVTISALASDSILILSPFNTPEAGSYTFIFKMYQDIPDAIPNNNVFSTSIIVDNHIYQVDNGSVYSSNTWAATTDFYEVGNLFELNSPGIASAVSAFVSPNTDVGALVYAILYKFDTTYNSFNFMDQSEEYIIQASDLGDTITMYFYWNSEIIDFGYYCAVVGSYGGANFEVGTSQAAPSMTSFYFDGDNYQWFLAPSTPVVRLHFDQFASNPQIELSDWTMYPNPANNIVNIQMPDNKRHTIEIKNALGQTVHSSSHMTSGSVNVSDFKAGVYIVSVDGLNKKLLID